MFKSKAIIKTVAFVDYLEELVRESLINSPDRFVKTEAEMLNEFIAETRELIDTNEWGLGLENLLDNLYEIDFKIDNVAIDLAKAAIEACGMDYSQFKYLEALKAKK